VLAFAKPSQALTLVLEGCTADVVPAVFNEKQQRLFGELNLKPGEIYKVAKE
jgi:hypothetical protein